MSQTAADALNRKITNLASACMTRLGYGQQAIVGPIVYSSGPRDGIYDHSYRRRFGYGIVQKELDVLDGAGQRESVERTNVDSQTRAGVTAEQYEKDMRRCAERIHQDTIRLLDIKKGVSGTYYSEFNRFQNTERWRVALKAWTKYMRSAGYPVSALDDPPVSILKRVEPLMHSNNLSDAERRRDLMNIQKEEIALSLADERARSDSKSGIDGLAAIFEAEFRAQHKNLFAEAAKLK